MKREYTFFTRTREQIKQLEEELEREERKQTEKERAAAGESIRSEAEMLMKCGEQIGQSEKTILDEEKKKTFCDLCEKAVRFAECMGCDLVVESDLKKRGRITLCGDSILFHEFTPKEILPIFLEMMGNADMAWYTAEKDMIHIRLEYELTDKALRRAD